jgi:hypothetical protein
VGERVRMQMMLHPPYPGQEKRPVRGRALSPRDESVRAAVADRPDFSTDLDRLQVYRAGLTLIVLPDVVGKALAA